MADDVGHLSAQQLFCAQREASLRLDLVVRVVFKKVVIKSLLLFLVSLKASSMTRINNVVFVGSVELFCGAVLINCC